MGAGDRGGKKDKDMDPEELMRRKHRAKCLFRALGRLVMANAHWLIEAVDHYEGVEDVKRRVEQAVRGKAKKKQLLNITDKALLNKPADERTDHEKQYLYRIIGGLKCFKRYPNVSSMRYKRSYKKHVKRKLAAVTYFKYYGPGRTIVRQHQEAHAMYFLVSGDVTISQLFFDELLQQYVSVDVGVMHAGDMFGEVSLLHNIPRTATCTTNDHCELLALMKEDFKSVLQASVQKQWDEVRRAMSAFTYFNGLDEVARREGCIVAKMKSYEIDETILGDGVGVPNFVYFVLSGKCQMIESIRMTVSTRLGRVYYTLYDPYIPKEESEQDLDTKYFEAYKNAKQSKDSTTVSKSVVISEYSQSQPGLSSTRASAVINATRSRSQKRESTSENRESIASTASATKDTAITDSKISAGSVLFDIADDVQPSGQSIRMTPENAIPPPLPQNMKTYFMQVCQMNPGSSFGFGENMRDRRVIALTPVDCMLLPKIWLLQRNTANIWTRIQHYLDKKVPTKKQLFDEFVSSRRWQEFRDELVEDVVAECGTVNWTTVHDVPYSIRMEEMLDI